MTSPRLVLPALLAVMVLIVACRHTSTHPRHGTHHPPTYQHKTQPLTSADPLAAKRGPLVQSLRGEPNLRIRIGRSLSTAALGSTGSVVVGPGNADLGKARPLTFQAPLRISHDKQGFVLTEPNGASVRWRLSTLEVTGNAGAITIGKNPYPGKIELVAVRSKAGQPTGQFDTINHVGMESYLPGVLSQELYASWDVKAYRAQAIAARSYAIWEMNLPIRRNSHFDLEAGEASQAYIGAKASDKAKAAVADTAGKVLVFERRVLPAFYSSCSGGVGQDAIAAWPNKVDDLAPLRGRVHGGWGQQSTKYRWGPVTLGTDQLASAFVSWGKTNKHPIAGLNGVRNVQPSARNSVGRPTRFIVTDAAGKRFELQAESLRFATNTALPGNAHRVKAKAFSSHTDYRITGNTVTITGQGFGHGVGMCQFGAQHMASEGYAHDKILGFYYPGARLQKAY